jgi:hypothetical protein
MIALGSKWSRHRAGYLVEVVGRMGGSVVVRQPSGECFTLPAPIFRRDYVEVVREIREDAELTAYLRRVYEREAARWN